MINSEQNSSVVVTATGTVSILGKPEDMTVVGLPGELVGVYVQATAGATCPTIQFFATATATATNTPLTSTLIWASGKPSYMSLPVWSPSGLGALVKNGSNVDLTIYWKQPGDGLKRVYASPWELISANSETSIRYGANTHFGLDYAVYSGDEPAVLDQLMDLGLNAIRDNVTWDKFETVAGVYTFNAAGDLYSQNMFEVFAYIKANNLNVHTTLGAMFGNALYAAPSVDLAAWSDHFCDAFESASQQYVAAGYDPALLTFELWNEPNTAPFGPYWDNDNESASLAVVMKDLYARIKAVDSRIGVIGPATADAWWYRHQTSWLQNFWSTSGWSGGMDAWSDHLYNASDVLANRIPESLYYFTMENVVWQGGVYNDYLAPAALADGTANLPIIINEWGYATNTDTNSVITKLLPRAFAIYSCIQRLREVTVYELIDSPSGTSYGICTTVGNPKTQGTAVAQTLAHLNLATRRNYFRTGAYNTGDHAVLLETPIDERLMIWTLLSSHAADILVISESPGTVLSIQTIGGSTATQVLAGGENVVRLTLSDTMQVLYADKRISFGIR